MILGPIINGVIASRPMIVSPTFPLHQLGKGVFLVRSLLILADEFRKQHRRKQHQNISLSRDGDLRTNNECKAN